jgi:hypothetical protein
MTAMKARGRIVVGRRRVLTGVLADYLGFMQRNVAPDQQGK